MAPKDQIMRTVGENLRTTGAVHEDLRAVKSEAKAEETPARTVLQKGPRQTKITDFMAAKQQVQDGSPALSGPDRIAHGHSQGQDAATTVQKANSTAEDQSRQAKVAALLDGPLPTNVAETHHVGFQTWLLDIDEDHPQWRGPVIQTACQILCDHYGFIKF